MRKHKDTTVKTRYLSIARRELFFTRLPLTPLHVNDRGGFDIDCQRRLRQPGLPGRLLELLVARVGLVVVLHVVEVVEG